MWRKCIYWASRISWGLMISYNRYSPNMNPRNIVPDIDERVCFLLCSFSINYILTRVMSVFGCHLVCNNESNFWSATNVNEQVTYIQIILSVTGILIPHWAQIRSDSECLRWRHSFELNIYLTFTANISLTNCFLIWHYTIFKKKGKRASLWFGTKP